MASLSRWGREGQRDLCLKRALKYQQNSYECVSSNIGVSLWYCNYLVFFTGFAVVVVVGFGVLLLSFLLLRFFCVALIWFDFFWFGLLLLGFFCFLFLVVLIWFF